MTRRGRCRCGAILDFPKTSQGYKTRCAQCQAVVRLRAEAATKAPSLPRMPAPVAASPVAQGLFLAEDSAEHTSPVADPEMPAYQDPKKNAMTFWLLGCAGSVVIVGIGIAVAVFGG